MALLPSMNYHQFQIPKSVTNFQSFSHNKVSIFPVASHQNQQQLATRNSDTNRIHQIPPNDLLSVLRRQKTADSALQIFHLVSKQSGFKPDGSIYEEILQQLGKAGSFDQMKALLKEMQDSGYQIEHGMMLSSKAYNPAIQALFKQRKTREALGLFREMERTAGVPDAVTYKIVFRGLCLGGGPIREAMDFLVEMVSKGYLPEVSSFSMLAEGLAGLAMEESLEMVYDLVMEKAMLENSEMKMVKGFLKIRKFHDALATFGQLMNNRRFRKKL